MRGARFWFSGSIAGVARDWSNHVLVGLYMKVPEYVIWCKIMSSSFVYVYMIYLIWNPRQRTIICLSRAFEEDSMLVEGRITFANVFRAWL